MAHLPDIDITTSAPLDLAVDALIVPVFRGAIEGPGAEAALRALGLEEVPRDASFRGRSGELLHLAAPGLACGQLTLVGLGRLDELSEEQLRRAAGAAVRALAPRCTSIATTLAMTTASAASVRATAEGALLGAYRYDEARSEADALQLERVSLVVPSALEAAAREAVRRAGIHARAQCVVRDLVTTPPNRLGPEEMVAEVQRLLEGSSIEIEAWDEDRLAAESCGGHLGVARGSARPPRLLRLRYRPNEPLARVALVGKGITFDSGGLSLKPSSGMEHMKGDMAGAAVVAGAFVALSELQVPVEVTGYLCLAENMPSGDAQRPSDVITIRGGTTVEVLNTDAEGRLVLADGLALAAEEGHDAIVDVATLTGAAMRAVGKRAAAAFGNDDDLLRQVLHAADEAGESTWHLPMWEELRDNLESEVADLDNLGVGDEAGATMAALFLREFVDGLPWVHLDIAGPFWQDEDRYHLSRHGTGFGVRTLLRWLEQTSTS